MLITAKREGMKMKVKHFSSYSSVLLLLLSCYSFVLFLRVCMLELGDKASYSFPVFPSPSFSFFLNSGDLEVQKKKLRASANWKKNSGDLEVQKKKLRASANWKKKKKLCASGYCAVKSNLEQLLLPLRLGTMNSKFHFSLYQTA